MLPGHFHVVIISIHSLGFAIIHTWMQGVCVRLLPCCTGNSEFWHDPSVQRNQLHKGMHCYPHFRLVFVLGMWITVLFWEWHCVLKTLRWMDN